MRWRQLGDAASEVYISELARRGSPMVGEAAEVWTAAKPHSLLCLAQMQLESELGTTGIATTGTRNPLGLKVRGQDDFMRFSTWADAVQEWNARITDPSYAYADAVTVEDYIHVYAPSWDGNDEAEYVGFIEDYVERYGRGKVLSGRSGVGTVPWPPMLDRPIVKSVGCGRDPDQKRTPVVGTVVHTMEGTLWGTDGWFRQDDVCSLTDYGIGQDGTIVRWNATDWQIGWASGPARAPNGNGARFIARWGANGVNRFLRSIEHEGEMDDPVSEAMWLKSC